MNNLYNFRDIGGIRTAEGTEVRTGLLYRSDELTKLKRHDIDTLLHLNIKTVLDLRTVNEVNLRPDDLSDNHQINVIHIPFTYDQKELGLKRFLWYLITKSNKFSFSDMIKNYYQAIAFDNTEQVHQVFEVISEKTNLPALIHCVSGKDRTGFITAIIYKLLKVPERLILKDYLCSNKNIKPELDKFIRYTRWTNLFQFSPQRVYAMLAQPEYLNFVFREIERRYKSIDQYLVKGCKVEYEQINQLKKILLS
ncbi:MAG: hypothetical protein APR63_00545 [Desulfuromonas sp. SDB]|nr:MAG: hypothetical protein APR63_00545 [Desulfuromonas sp. SDB]